MSPPNDHERAFADHLDSLAKKEDRAALAALRRGLGKPPGVAAEMHPYLARWLPADAPLYQDEPYYTVAALFAWHQGTWKAPSEEKQATNLGASFARLAKQVESGSIEKRFVALLNCHRDDLHVHLRHAVGILKSKDVPVDWAQLLHDIRGWDWESRQVQRQWAKAFWARGKDPDADAQSADTQQPGSP